MIKPRPICTGAPVAGALLAAASLKRSSRDCKTAAEIVVVIGPGAEEVAAFGDEASADCPAAADTAALNFPARCSKFDSAIVTGSLPSAARVISSADSPDVKDRKDSLVRPSMDSVEALHGRSGSFSFGVRKLRSSRSAFFRVSAIAAAAEVDAVANGTLGVAAAAEVGDC